MTIIWKGSPNKDGEEFRKPIDRVVLHWFGIGTLDSANTRFQNPSSSVSAHYGISDNTVYQWVKEEEVAWHSGDYPMNQRSIGIEHDATTEHNASDSTYNTSATLIAEICYRYSIPPDRMHIIKHNQVVPTQCCGTLDIDRIVKYVQWILEHSISPSTSPSPSPSTSPSEPVVTINKTFLEKLIEFLISLFRR